MHGIQFTYVLVLTLFSLPLNGISVAILIKGRRQFRRKWFILLNMAFSHLLQTLVSFPLLMATYYLEERPFSLMVCRLDSFLVAVCGFEDIFTHLVLCIERYVTIKYAMNEEAILTTNKLKLISVSSWLISISFAFPPLVGWSSYEPSVDTHCSSALDYSLDGLSYILTCSLFAFIVPFLIIVIFNSFLLYRIRQMNQKEKISPSISVFLILSTISFTLAWTPLVVILYNTMIWKEQIFSDVIVEVANMLTKTTTVIDTMIFLVLNKNFVETARSIPRRGLAGLLTD